MISLDDVNLQEIMKETGYSKIKSIKRLQEITGLSLQECKDAFEAPYNEFYESNPKTRVDPNAHYMQPIKAVPKKERVEHEGPKVIYDQTKEDPTIPRCPKCGSTSITGNKKGFGAGKAALGVIAVGVIGLAAGGIGSNKVILTCMNCGHQFKPGKRLF